MAIPSRGQRVRGAPEPRQLPVTVDWGLAYEALVGLALFIGGETESTYEVGESWFRSVRRRGSVKLRESARSVAGKDGHILVGLAGLVRGSGGRSVADLVSRLRQESSSDVKRIFLAHSEPQHRDAILRGDRDPRREFLKDLSPGFRQVAKRALETEPRTLARRMADVIERWDEEIFSELGGPLKPDLEASAQSARRLSRQLPTDRLIVKVTHGVEYRPEPWIDSVVLVPSILNRPWVDILEFHSTKYFIYPASPDSVAPDVELVEVYKALGDETRLRILRLMSSGITSLTDLAEKLGLAKSTVHGHMVILRMAGLTRSVVGGEGKGYVLNERPDLNSLLDSYLRTAR
ncbi:MAG: winged helix-turn-helix transcriptional regulator [Chloroflexi bacterium]|nr:MAG: winged helix-turn-helix transcriptional regulator [Chloroflexota bacterium]